MIKEITAEQRIELINFLEKCLYDRVLIDSVLEGKFGKAYVNSKGPIEIVRLDSASITILYGNSDSICINDIIKVAPIYYVTPQNTEWETKLRSIYENRINVINFINYTPNDIKKDHLRKIIDCLDPSYQIKQIDNDLAKRVEVDIENEYFFENFISIEDYLRRGIGFCVCHENKLVSAATSMAQSSKAIDIEIETISKYRKLGLGTIVGAKLVLFCLENKIEPKWIAVNKESGSIASKLGFKKGESYTTFEIQH